MKKIILSILAIALTVGAVSGTAYALFSSTVQVQGITMTSGNADLKVYDGPLANAHDITNGWAGLTLSGLYPGFMDYGSFTFKNTSNSNIKLELTAQLTAATGDWGALKDNIYVAIGTGTKANPTYLTDWISLNDWNTAPHSLGVPALTQAEPETYNMYVYIPANVGNDIANKSLPNITFQIVGTQTN
jgi:hypothetical protein